MINLLISFTAGLFVKIVDLSEDDGLRIDKYLKILLSVIYGLLIGYLMLVLPLKSLWLGLLLGLLLSGKIDSKSHITGVILIIIVLLLFGELVINPFLLLLITFLTIIEEWLNDEIVDKKKVSGWLLKFLRIRPLFEIACFTLSAYYNEWIIFFAIVSFDAGYLSAQKYAFSLIKTRS